jgi:hypothetical protein
MLVAVLLNPSRGEDQGRNQTTDPLRWYATQSGYGGLEILNAFSYRATNPKDLNASRDRSAPENDAHIVAAIKSAGRVVVGWGDAITHRALLYRVRELQTLLGSEIYCLGLNLSGQPRHPRSPGGFGEERFNWQSRTPDT